MEGAGAWGCGRTKGKARGSAKREEVTCNRCRASFSFQRGDISGPIGEPPTGQNSYVAYPPVEPDIFKRRGWKRPIFKGDQPWRTDDPKARYLPIDDFDNIPDFAQGGTQEQHIAKLQAAMQAGALPPGKASVWPYDNGEGRKGHVVMMGDGYRRSNAAFRLGGTHVPVIMSDEDHAKYLDAQQKGTILRDLLSDRLGGVKR